MTEGAVTLAFQVLILIVAIVALWHVRRAWRMVAETLALIQQYRREIDWLTSRIEAVENKQKSAP